MNAPGIDETLQDPNDLGDSIGGRIYRLRMGNQIFRRIGHSIMCLIAIGVVMWFAVRVVEVCDNQRPAEDLGVGLGVLVMAVVMAGATASSAYMSLDEIVVGKDEVIIFRNRFREVVLPARTITNIRTGGFSDPQAQFIRVDYSAKTLVLPNAFDQWYDFLSLVKTINPAVEIKGF